MKVRRAREEDIPGLIRLLYQVDGVHHNGRPDLFRGPAVKYQEKELAEMIEGSAPVFAAVTEDGFVAGHAFCQIKQAAGHPVLTDIKTLYIDDICVDEAWRGRGVGRLLYEQALAFAREQGCYNVTLNVWAFNEGAVRFYEKLGMHPQKIGMETIL
ncbi:MAG: GNAT family N-acetyltransferase [Lachnospiraceae bacterium]|nr:GNAT family N-acetyltransferase [Lachnospiraceae bacterium]